MSAMFSGKMTNIRLPSVLIMNWNQWECLEADCGCFRTFSKMFCSLWNAQMETLRMFWGCEESQMFKVQWKSGALFCCSHNKLIQYASLSSTLNLSYHNGKQSHLQCKCLPLQYRIVWVIVPFVPSTKDNRYCLKSIRWCQEPVTPITTTPISL